MENKNDDGFVINVNSCGNFIAKEMTITDNTFNYSNGHQDTLQQRQVELSTMVGCVDRVRQYFWSDSSMAVVFCVCRDYFNYADNMSQFERDFNCAEGLLSNTFRNNAYMRLPIDKWEQNGAKERVMKLVEAYQNAVLEASQK